jgi:AraC-like DNA-binding protein
MSREAFDEDFGQRVGGWLCRASRHGAAAAEIEEPTGESGVSGSPAPANGTTVRFLAGLTVAEWERLAAAAWFQAGPLASLCGVRPRLLERFFNRRFGQTPVAWMREVRCGRAVTLLLNGAYTKEAAGAVCYATSSQFCHEFNKVFGVSPRRYVRGMARGGGVRSVLERAMTFFGNQFMSPHAAPVAEG